MIKAKIDLENKYNLITQISPLIPITEKNGYFVKLDSNNTDSPGYGGTKLRKLEYLLWSLKEKYGVDKIESYGAYGSFHLLTLAYWAKKFGMEMNAKIWSQPFHVRECRNLISLKKICTEVKWIHPLQVPFLTSKIKISKKHKKAFIPIGGDLLSGAWALYKGIFELDKQIDLTNAVIVTAAGTCASVSGLLVGAVELNKNIKIIGVNITSIFYSQRTRVFSTVKTIQDITGKKRSVEKESLECKFGGEKLHFVEYGRILSDFAHYDKLAKIDGFNIDPTYTSKSFKVFYNYKKREKDGNVIYWHSKP